MVWGDIVKSEAVGAVTGVPGAGTAYSGWKGDNQTARGLIDPFNISGTTGKGDVETPQMSAEEKAYLGEITGMIQEQRKYNERMMPVYAHQMHYKIGSDGAWEQMSDQEWLNDPRTTDAQREQWQIGTETRQRHLKALRGELPLTEQMQQQKAQEFEDLKSASGITGTLDKAGGGDTVGIRKLDAFRKRWNLLEEQQRHGQLGAGQQMNLGQTSLLQQGAAGRVGSLQGIGGMSQQSIQNYGSLLQPYQAYNQMRHQASAASAANQAAQQSSTMGLAGMLGAAAIASERKDKKNIKKKSKSDEERALAEIRGTDSYEYRYKDRMGLGPQKNLGSMADESPDAYTVPESQLMAQGASEEDFYEFEDMMRQRYPGEAAPAPSEEDFYAFEEHMRRKYPGKSKKAGINLGNKLEHQGMGLKALARKVEALERRAK